MYIGGRNLQPPVSKDAEKYAYLTIILLTIDEKTNNYELFKDRYEIIKVKVNGENRNIKDILKNSQNFALSIGKFEIKR